MFLLRYLHYYSGFYLLFLLPFQCFKHHKVLIVTALYILEMVFSIRHILKK